MNVICSKRRSVNLKNPLRTLVNFRDEFNNFRISARISLIEKDTGKQISQTNLDFQVYRNGNFRMGKCT